MFYSTYAIEKYTYIYWMFEELNIQGNRTFSNKCHNNKSFYISDINNWIAWKALEALTQFSITQHNIQSTYTSYVLSEIEDEFKS